MLRSEHMSVLFRSECVVTSTTEASARPIDIASAAATLCHVRPQQPVVHHISDTALWVTALRARESRRPDAVFRDLLSERLADERAEQIANALSRPVADDWVLVARTTLIDELVLSSIREGADRVINLAAGLDTRPYRLDLPASLSWIEADLPQLIDEKERLLQQDRPRCHLRREKVDLTDPDARRGFLERALEGARSALVLTEGLLVYLEPAQVADLARDLRARDSVRWWMTDLASPGVLKILRQRIAAKLGANATLKFAPEEGVAFFRPLGWKTRDVRSFLREAARLRRIPWWMRLAARLPEPNPTKLGPSRPWVAIVRFEQDE